jgi:LacI family transcriptional regulator
MQFMKQNFHSPVTLKDIAGATGYSVNTISRALRGKDDIAPVTIEKIKKTAAKMGYISNSVASSLRSGRTNTIAVILSDISNPHFSIMMKEIEIRARADGYSSFLINTNEDSKMEREAILTALKKNVDGLIICPAQHDDSNIRYLMKAQIPFVQVGRYFSHLNACYVVCDDEMGGYQATKYLLNKGHRNILMLNGPLYISSARERMAGYRKAFRELKIAVKPELIREVPITSNGCASVIARILKEKIKFSAIFAFSDILAWDAWSCLHKQGFRIPQDYSLIGFDNIQSRLEIPFQLSTISSYKAKISTAAVECLLCIIRGEKPDMCKDRGLCRQVISTRLITGETGHPAKSR